MKKQINNNLIDMTTDEVSKLEADRAKALTEKQAYETAKTQKEANKASAQAKLSALGLTTEEIKALIGQ